MKTRHLFMKAYSILAVIIFASSSRVALLAQGNLVYNGGFEAFNVTNGVANGWNFSKWVGVGAGGDPGLFALLYNSGVNDPTIPTASQTITGLNPGDTYTISGNYELWKNPNGNVFDSSFGVAVNGNFLFETVAPATSLTWENFSFVYTATSSSMILSLSSQLNGTEVSYGIDNIAMYAVPEPSTLSLFVLASGAFALFYVRTRNKKHSEPISSD
jgi:PEP-CTERM motif